MFGLGIGSFVAGAIFFKKISSAPNQEFAKKIEYRKIVVLCIAIHLIAIPLSWVEISNIGGDAGDIFILAYRLRNKSVSGEEVIGPIVGNYLLGAFLFIPILLLGWINKQVTTLEIILISLPWILLNLLVNGRSGLITLIFSLAYIYAVSGGRFSTKFLVSFSILFVSIMIAGNLLVGKIEANIEDKWILILEQSLIGFLNYFLQGPILFSQYFESPNDYNPTWDALIFPCYILQKIDLCVTPALHQEYSAFTLDGDIGNVYSIFLSVYPKYDFTGVVILFFCYGAWASFHHERRRSSFWNVLMASLLFSAIFISIFADSFAPNLYFFIKLYICNLVVIYAFKKT